MLEDVQADVLVVEPAVPADVQEGLRGRGHAVELSKSDWSSAQALRYDADSLWFTGGSDPRSDGLALGPAAQPKPAASGAKPRAQ